MSRTAASLAALITLALSACSTSPPNVQPRQGGTLYVALPSEPASLNPLVANDPVSQRAYAPLFPLLYSMAPDLSVAPALATAQPAFSDAGRTLTVTLRADATWSDGKPVTADDVVYTVSTEMNPALPSHASFDWRALTSVSKVDAHTVRFSLARADAAFAATSLVIPIVPAHVLSGIDPTMMAGSAYSGGPTVTGGPFRFGKRVAGESITLSANPAYYAGRPHADSLVERIVADPNAVVAQLGASQLSFAPDLSPMAAAQAVIASGVTVYSYAETSLVGLQFNVRRGRPFAASTTRQALAYSLDHDGIVAAATGTAQGYPVWGDINPASWAYDPGSTNRYATDAGRARQLLHGARPTATLLYPSSDPARAMVAALVLQQAQAAGFRLTPRGVADPAFASALAAGTFDAALISVPGGIDPDSSALLASAAPANAGGYHNAAVDALLQSELGATPSASMTLNQVRKPIFDRIEQIVTTDLPVYFLWAPRHFVGLSAIVGGVSATGLQLDRCRDNTFYVNWFLTG